MNKVFNILKRAFSILKPQPEQNYSSGKTWEELYADLGAFQYSDDGFTLTYGDFTITLNWNDITELNVYKKDLITFDQITMQIVFGSRQIEISEELPGWYQFVSRTKEVFSSIPKDWDIEIIQPPFAANYKTIYSKPE